MPFLFMDVFRPLPYFEELLNLMVIKAVTALPFIHEVDNDHEAWERGRSLIWK